MSYPKMAIFLGYNTADQTYSIEYAESMRNWEANFRFSDNTRYYPTVNVKTHVAWDEVMYIFGVWKQKPNWKEMKQCYKKCFYFRNERRDKINKLLSENK